MLKKIDILKYINEDDFGCLDKELSVKNKWDNKLLLDKGAIAILESPNYSHKQKIEKLRELIQSEKNHKTKAILEVMLFNIKFNSLDYRDNNEYILSYNSDYECFYIAVYSSAKKARIYVSRKTVEKILNNEILNN